MNRTQLAAKPLRAKMSDVNVVQQTDEAPFTNKFFDDRVAIRLVTGIHVVQFCEIIRVEADGAYSTIYLQDGKKLVVSKTLSRIEERLPSTFVRVHQSHIVNLLHFKYLDKREGYIVTMSDDSKIGLSIRKRDSFMQELEKFIEF